jgi:putative sterol carrier protein
MEQVNVKEFFESLPAKVGDKAEGMTQSYLFDIHDVGSWLVAVDNGKVTVTEGDGEADVRIGMSEEIFHKLLTGEQNPMRGVMTGKIKLNGNVAAATKLGKLFG